MFEEFKKFAMRGNVIDLAVGVIIGASFTGIVNSLVKDVIMPPIGLALGGVDFSNFFFVIKGDRAVDTLTAAKAAKDVTINYGLFINAVINFLIVAFVLFILLRQLNKLVAPTPSTEAAPPPSEEILLLREIPRQPEGQGMKAFALWSLLLLSVPLPLAAQTNAATPDAAASGFLSVYGSFHPSDGIPDVGAARAASALSLARAEQASGRCGGGTGALRRQDQGFAAVDRRRYVLVDVRRRHPVQASGLRRQRQPGALSGRLHPCRIERQSRQLDRHVAAGEYARRLAGWMISPMAAAFSSAIPAGSATRSRPSHARRLER